MISRPNVRQSTWLADVGVLVLVAAGLYGVSRIVQHGEAPLQLQPDIELSLWALPGYTLLSLLRGFLAYGISLVFAILYGYVASHSPRAERVMVPLLDVLQSIPVLGFLPSAVLLLIALFPTTNLGLELVSILMIFTSQVWNMAFSVYQSLRNIPHELREASALYQFSGWQRFRRLELPAAAVGLAWNSMMAMAGGWFFLMVCEAFTLGARDFRLPGLGAYMSVAIAHHDARAIAAGLVAMVLMIVLVDVCVWRPILVWVQKFRLGEATTAEAQGSMVLNWFRRSTLIQVATARLAHPISEWLSSMTTASVPSTTHVPRSPLRLRTQVITGVCLIAGAGATVWAALGFAHLVSRLSIPEWGQVIVGAGFTLLRVAAAVMLGTLWTIPVGMWIGQSRTLRNRLQPLVQVAASFPAPMLYPLVLLALRQLGWGLGVGASILMLLGTQWYVLFNVIAGASAVPDELQEVAQAYHFTRWQRWRTLWWPGIFPYLITGWVTAAGGAWNASIVAEYVSIGGRTFTAPGLGSLISVAAGQGAYSLLAAGVLTMAVVVLLVNRMLWKPLYRLGQTRYAYS